MPHFKLVIWAFVVFAGTILWNGCSSKQNPMEPMDSGGNNPVTNTAATNMILISGYVFSPTPLTVTKGSYLYWKNNDGTAHTATADVSSAFVFNTGTIAASGGMSSVIAFTQIGTFTYHCAFHGSMTGSITVQ